MITLAPCVHIKVVMDTGGAEVLTVVLGQHVPLRKCTSEMQGRRGGGTAEACHGHSDGGGLGGPTPWLQPHPPPVARHRLPPPPPPHPLLPVGAPLAAIYTARSKLFCVE